MGATSWQAKNLDSQRPCSKCGTPTDRRTSDDVSGAVGIPLCPQCAQGTRLRFLLLLLVALFAAIAWMV